MRASTVLILTASVLALLLVATKLTQGELIFLDYCNREVDIDQNAVNVRLQSQQLDQQRCVVTFRSLQNGTQLQLEWSHFDVGMKQECLPEYEYKYCPQTRRDQDGLAVYDSDGVTNFYSPMDRYYASIQHSDRFHDEVICKKNNMTETPCDVIWDWIPFWGNQRALRSSGSSLTIDYLGIPVTDFFEFQVIPVEVSDECNTQPCTNGGACRLDNDECICTSAYNGDQCQHDTDECKEFQACQSESQYCKNTIGSYECPCRPGFEPSPDNTTCLDVDECESGSVCSELATCTNSVGSYICSCPAGYSGDGSSCSRHCTESTCHNGGTCHNSTGSTHGFICMCASGFTGFDCKIDIDQCLSNPCNNEGVCIDTPKGYECACLEGYVGRTCRFRAYTLASLVGNDITRIVPSIMTLLGSLVLIPIVGLP